MQAKARLLRTALGVLVIVGGALTGRSGPPDGQVTRPEGSAAG
jgi:hypothetical protein